MVSRLCMQCVAGEWRNESQSNTQINLCLIAIFQIVTDPRRCARVSTTFNGRTYSMVDWFLFIRLKKLSTRVCGKVYAGLEREKRQP